VLTVPGRTTYFLYQNADNQAKFLDLDKDKKELTDFLAANSFLEQQSRVFGNFGIENLDRI